MTCIFLDPTLKEFPATNPVLLPSDKDSKSMMVRWPWPEGQVCPRLLYALLIIIYVVKFETVKVRSRETKSRDVILPIQINHQLDATISPVFYLMFIYSSTCFGGPHAHHQELNNCSSSLWFYRWNVVVAVLLVVIWPAGPTTTNSTATTTLQR
jgi:hypothetical protein